MDSIHIHLATCMCVINTWKRKKTEIKLLLIIRNILLVSTPKPKKFRLLCTHSMTLVFHFRSLFLCIFFWRHGVLAREKWPQTYGKWWLYLIRRGKCATINYIIHLKNELTSNQTIEIIVFANEHLPNTCRQTGVMAFFSKFHFLLFFSSTDIYDETTERKVKKKPRFIVGLLDKRR